MVRAVTILLLVLCAGTVAAEDVAEVVTEGIGKDVESATQRAAEAALTQVVGSFVDSDKMVQRHKEIRDGIKTQTKSVSSKIREYSQGSIQSIEVVEVETLDGGLVRVTAKVGVRIEDFRHYMEETVLAEKEIEQGLLAKIKTREKQTENVAALLVERVINPLLQQQVVVPEIIGDIQDVTDQIGILAASRFLKGDGHLIRVPVTVSLSPDYLGNATAVLEETARNRYRGLALGQAEEINKQRISPEKIAFYGVTIGDFISLGNNGSVGKNQALAPRIGGAGAFLTALKAVFPPDDLAFTTYTFPETVAGDLCKSTESALGWGALTIGTLQLVRPVIKLGFVADSGDSVFEDLLTPRNKRIGSETSIVLPRDISSQTARKLNWLPYYGSEAATLMGSTLIYSHRHASYACMLFINSESEFQILAKVPEKVLAQARKVTVSYAEPNHKPIRRSKFRF